MPNQPNLENLENKIGTPLENKENLEEAPKSESWQEINRVENQLESSQTETVEVISPEKTLEEKEVAVVAGKEERSESPIEKKEIASAVSELKEIVANPEAVLETDLNPAYKKLIFEITENIRETSVDNDALAQKKVEEIATESVRLLPAEDQLSTKEFLKQVLVDEIRKNNLRAGN